MSMVRAKKRLGQHFLKDKNIAADIVNALLKTGSAQKVIEVGPGTGVLSEMMIGHVQIEQLVLMDLDEESIAYLNNNFKNENTRIVHGDFLKTDLRKYFGSSNFNIIGNFPYNISTQIFFKVLAHRNQIDIVVGMLQKEVAERIASKEGSKVYGIISVLIQAFYDVEYLFTVPPTVFIPPPKVDSGVIIAKRNDVEHLGCDEKLFSRVVKTAFQTRRKTLRNALKTINLPDSVKESSVLNKRAEQLSVEDFIMLTKQIEGQ
ncbi:MAG: 16S rRNA (adenine(1518)-N(6)/adenine(1519)-N(6))-dimethyltransferase RsmA [Reichenbachiella sp.]